MIAAPQRLRLDSGALVANWRLLADLSGDAACGAAVKANGYGLGAAEVVAHLSRAGCRDFFVATWGEALALVGLGQSLSVLHGVRDDDLPVALGNGYARPVLNSIEQVRRWREAGGGLCDVMVDTGMHRLGVSMDEVLSGALDGLNIENLMTHLASADEAVPLNAQQLERFAALRGKTGARRMSMANSAGITLGRDYHFDLTRPGLALYGGIPCPALEGRMRQVVTPQAQILQRRTVRAGGSVGYNATWTATTDTEVAILNLGYADGYLRGFSGRGIAYADDISLPVIGRVSMDLTAVDVTAMPSLSDGDWLTISYDLPQASAQSGLSQYELLTGLGARYERIWY